MTPGRICELRPICELIHGSVGAEDDGTSCCWWFEGLDTWQVVVDVNGIAYTATSWDVKRGPVRLSPDELPEDP